jgi:hypothetical protein
MDIISLGYSITFFWIALHLVHRCCIVRFKARNILPTVSLVRNRRGRRWLSTEHFTLAISPAHFKLQTTSLNDIHDSWVLFFQKTSHSTLSRVFVIFYNLGSVLGALGMVIAIALLSITVYQSLLLTTGPKASTFDNIVPSSTQSLHRRTLEPERAPGPDVTAEGSSIPLQLIVSRFWLLNMKY